jgi:DNA-binding MarR family transcriptional regulator
MENIMLLLDSLQKKCSLNEKTTELELKLSSSEYKTLFLFDEQKISCSKLASKLNLSPSRCTRVVDKLIAHGFSTRQTATADRRQFHLTLTKKGKNYRNKILQHRSYCANKLTKALDKKQLSSIEKSLNLILKVI